MRLRLGACFGFSGSLDFLDRFGGDIDPGLVDPHRDSSILQPLNQAKTPSPILRRITYKNFCADGYLLFFNSANFSSINASKFSTMLK